MNSDGWQRGSATASPMLRAIQPIAMSKMFFSGICDAENMV